MPKQRFPAGRCQYDVRWHELLDCSVILRSSRIRAALQHPSRTTTRRVEMNSTAPQCNTLLPQALKSLLALVGVAALAAISSCRKRSTMPLAAGLPALPVAAPPQRRTPPTADRAVETPLEREQRAVAEYIAKRYRIADDAAAHFVVHRLPRRRAASPRRAADPRGDGDRVALQPGGRERDGREGPDAGDPASTTRRSCSTHGGEQALLEPEVNIRSAPRSCASTSAASATPRPRCRCTPARSTSRPRSTPTRCSPRKPRLDALRFKARKQQKRAIRLAASSRSSMLRV